MFGVGRSDLGRELGRDAAQSPSLLAALRFGSELFLVLPDLLGVLRVLGASFILEEAHEVAERRNRNHLEFKTRE